MGWRGQFLLVDPVPQPRQFPHSGTPTAKVNLLTLDNESKFIRPLPGRLAQSSIHDRDSLLPRCRVTLSLGTSVALRPTVQRLLVAQAERPGQVPATHLNVATGFSVKEACQAGATSSIAACSTV